MSKMMVDVSLTFDDKAFKQLCNNKFNVEWIHLDVFCHFSTIDNFCDLVGLGFTFKGKNMLPEHQILFYRIELINHYNIARAFLP